MSLFDWLKEDPPVHPYDLRCEKAENPLHIDSQNPRFSWRIPSKTPSDFSLEAYQLQVLHSNGSVLWDTGYVESSKAIEVIYDGPPLPPLSCFHWQVRLLGRKTGWEPWSRSATFETALCSVEDFRADWITDPNPSWYIAGQWESGTPHMQTSEEEGRHTLGIYLGTSFTLDQGVDHIQRARAFVGGVGVYRLYLNGSPVGGQILSPAQSDYRKRVLYDVISLDSPLARQTYRSCEISLFLGNGRHIPLYGFDKPRGFVLVLIEYKDGSRQWIPSDSSWKVLSGPIRENSLFNGEVFDSRIPLGSVQEKSQASVEVVEPYPLQASSCPPITIDHTITAQKMWKTKDGYIYDFGQNFSGFVRLQAHQPTGTKLTMAFAELVDAQGNLNASSNRKARAVDTYICNGESIDWHPVSTYHGFRYVLLSGYEGAPHLQTLTGLFVHTETREKGTFTCSHDGLNRVHEAVRWGLLSNMMGIPTDSPQRDERHGWLGDALLAAPAALLNFEATRFYEKYLQDIVDTQNEDGSITDVAPKFWMDKPADPAWGSAFISLAWYLYWYEGDIQVLHRWYPHMCRYIDFLLSQSTDGIVRNLGTFGDWCAPGLVTSKKTGLPWISTWYLHHDLRLLAAIATVVGDEEGQKRFSQDADRIGKALMDHYWKADHMESLPQTPWDFPDQTSQALTLASDLLEEQKAALLATYLDKLVAATSGDHVGTGIHGTRYLLEQLSRWGKTEKAFTLATQESYPGWLYMLREGATTLWERWEYIACEGMNSHNHIMLGSIDQWFYEWVAGIRPIAPGWAEIAFSPARFSELSYASASVETRYGTATISWDRQGPDVVARMCVPPEAEGLLFLPLNYNDFTWRSLEGGIAAASFQMQCHPRQPYPLDRAGYWRLTAGAYVATWREAEEGSVDE